MIRIRVIAAACALICASSLLNSPASAAPPALPHIAPTASITVLPGSQAGASLLGAFKLQSFGSHSNSLTADDLFLGITSSDATPFKNRVNFYNNDSTPSIGVKSGDCDGNWDTNGSNSLVMEYQPAVSDRLTITLSNTAVVSDINCSLIFNNFTTVISTQKGLAASQPVPLMNYIEVTIKRNSNGYTSTLSNLTLNGTDPLGTFSPSGTTPKTSNITGFHLGDGFKLSGSLDLSGAFGNCADSCAVEVSFGTLPTQIAVQKTVSGLTPATAWQFAGPKGNFTLPAIGGSTVITPLGSATYSITETARPGFVASTSCTNGASGSNSVSLTPDAGATITCTFANTFTPTYTTITVTPAITQGWASFAEPTLGIAALIPLDIQSPPPAPALGIANAALVLTDTNIGKLYGASILTGTKLSDLLVLTYSTYLAGGQVPALQIGWDDDSTDVNTGWRGRLVFVPSGTTVGAWQTWNALSDSAGMWHTTYPSLPDPSCNLGGSGCTWSQILTKFPNAIVHDGYYAPPAPPNTPIGFVGVKAGSGGTGLSYFDGLTIAADQNVITYDFEPECNPYRVFNVNSGKAFCSIQAAIDDSATIAGHTISATAGAYSEILTITKGITLTGAPGTTIMPPYDISTFASARRGALIWVDANDVTIRDLTIDGDNPFIGGGFPTPGGKMNAARAIYIRQQDGQQCRDGLQVENNVIRNVARGMNLYCGANHVIQNNQIFDLGIGANDGNYGYGVLLQETANGIVANNTVTNAASAGVFLQNSYTSQPVTFTNNVITNAGIALGVNLIYGNGSAVVQNNSVYSASLGVQVTSIQFGAATIQNNTFTLTQPSDVGMIVWNVYPGTTQILSNTIEGGDIGVQLTDDESTFGLSSLIANTLVLQDNSIRNANIGVQVYAATLDRGAVLTATGNNIGNNLTAGMQITGSGVATVTASNNNLIGNGIGISNTTSNAVNASLNWWNAANGPGPIAGGSGDGVSANVAYCPWLDAAAPGGSSLHPVTNVDTTEGFCNIQSAIDDADTLAGHTISVTAGIYKENVNVTKMLTITGAGNGDDPSADTIVQGSGAGNGFTLVNGAGATQRQVLQNLRVTGYSNGVALGSYTTLEGVAVISNVQNGLNLNPLTDLRIIDSYVDGNGLSGGTGLRVGTAVNVNGLTVLNSTFNGNGIGWYLAAGTPANSSTVQNVVVQNTTFNNNLLKGIYAEKLEDALFQAITITNSGISPSYGFNNGIDINLKYGAYQNIYIYDSSITGSGAQGTAVDPTNPAAVAIKARDDGSYGSTPATLDNVVISRTVISGPVNGIRFGEFGKTNATPTHAHVIYSSIDGNVASYGLIKNITASLDASCSWWQDVTGPSSIAGLNPGGMGRALTGTNTSGLDFNPWLLSSDLNGDCSTATLVVQKVVSSAVPLTDWQFAGPTGTFTLPAAGGSITLTGLAPYGTVTVTETTKPAYLASAVCSNGSTGSNAVNVPFTSGITVTCTFTNAFTLPNTTITSGPALTTNAPYATFVFTGADLGATGSITFECQLDGGGWSACASPQVHTSLADGSHTFAVRAVDAVGNIDDTPATFTWLIDLVAPVTTITNAPASPTSASSATLVFTGTDTGGSGISHFEYRLNGSTWLTTTNTSVAYTGLSNGSYQFDVRAVDNVGNIDVTYATAIWIVDSIAPDTSITSAPAPLVLTSTATLVFTGTDAGGSGVAYFEYALDGGATLTTTFTTLTFTGLSDGPHTFTVAAVDNVGNVDATPAATSWTVDTLAPDTTITISPTTPTSSTAATIVFTGSDSGSGVASFMCSLDGAPATTCISPVNLVSLSDGSHSFNVFAVDNVGNTDPTPANAVWLVDATPPDTSIITSPAAQANTASATFSFTGNDGSGTGVTGFECRLDGGMWTSCISPKSYTGLSEGSHTFEVRARDAASNLDPTPDSFTWLVDTVAPDSLITIAPATLISSTSASVTFTATDGAGSGLASFECRLDGGGFTACASPTTLSSLADGLHLFDVRAIDNVGNVETSPASAAFTVDATPPTTTIDIAPPAIDSANASFSFSGGDGTGSGVAGFECNLDGGGWAACSSPAAYNGLSTGNHTFEVRAVDNANNADASPASHAWMVDGDLPNTSINAAPPAATTDINVTIVFTGADTTTPAGSLVFECSVDGGAWATCTSPFTQSGLAQGTHTFAVRAIDEGNNVDPSPATAVWLVDTDAPDTTITSAPPAITSSNSAVLTFIGADTLVPAGSLTFECSVDGGAWATCASPLALVGLSNGNHTFAVRAKDTAGNIDPTPASHTWLVDATAPDTLILSQPANPTNQTSASFTLSSTGSLSTVTYECRLDGSAWVACNTPHAVTLLSDGSHTFEARATSAAGLTDATPAGATWLVDATAPDTTITAQPPAVSGSNVAFSFSGDDGSGSGVASFECRLDAGAWTACMSPQAYSGLSNGNHTFAVRALDNAGNVDPSPDSVSWTVNSTMPETLLLSAPPTVTQNTSANFTFIGIDDIAPSSAISFECRLDGGAWAACTSPKNYTGFVDGSHTFEVRAIDNGGNIDPTPASHTWEVKTTVIVPDRRLFLPIIMR